MFFNRFSDRSEYFKDIFLPQAVKGLITIEKTVYTAKMIVRQEPEIMEKFCEYNSQIFDGYVLSYLLNKIPRIPFGTTD